MLVELHSLTSHAPANLNRDDLGRPKSAVFGGTQRARISSQAIKRSIRTSNYLEEELGSGLSTRSQHIPSMIYKEFLADYAGDTAMIERLRTVCEAFTKVLGKPDGKDPMKVSQIVFMTPGEIERSRNAIRRLVSSGLDLKEQVAAAEGETKGKKGKGDKQSRLEQWIANAATDIGLNKNPGDGVDLALFGRMTTDEANRFTNVDASMQVAHAISTHTVVPEVDWFTAVDDVTTGLEDRGSAHLGEVEFNSAVFYKYFSCNFQLLLGNMNLSGEEAGDRKVGANALIAVLDASCQVTPSGKQNSFASHSKADTVLAVIRSRKVPVSLANAFEKPVPSSEEGFLAPSRRRLANHFTTIRNGYHLHEDFAVCFCADEEGREEMRARIPNVLFVSSLPELLEHTRVVLEAGILPELPRQSEKAPAHVSEVPVEPAS